MNPRAHQTPVYGSYTSASFGSQSKSHSGLMASCLLIMTLTCIGFLMYMLRAILIPFAVAMLLTYLIGPLVDLLTLPPLKCLDAREREKKYQNDNGNYTDVTGDETRIYSTQGKELLGLEDDDCCEPNIIGINLTTTNLNKDVHNAFKLDMRSKDNSNKKKLTGMNRADIEKSSTYKERMSSTISTSSRMMALHHSTSQQWKAATSPLPPRSHQHSVTYPLHAPHSIAHQILKQV